MQELTIVYMEYPWEAQAVFLNGEIIDAWSMNDADWRGEYFNGFMKKLGIKVKTKSATNDDKRAILTYFGEDLDTYLEEE